MRWIDQENKDFEKDGVLLAWDNIHKDTLIRDPRIYQMLLFGYNRNSERILIASSDGTNREYRVFCPKIISSVQPLHSYYEFEELKRRLLLICHKQYEKFTSQDREGLPEDFDINTNRIDLDSINLPFLAGNTKASGSIAPSGLAESRIACSWGINLKHPNRVSLTVLSDADIGSHCFAENYMTRVNVFPLEGDRIFRSTTFQSLPLAQRQASEIP